MSAAPATARRVLRQLRHSPRTIALMMAVPCVLVTVLYADNLRVFDSAGAPLLVIFPLFTMFLVASITPLRERATGRNCCCAACSSPATRCRVGFTRSSRSSR
jgi:ABC-2 type transport system permease protein